MTEKYVDAVIIPVPCDEIDAYQEMAQKAGEIWIKHGALAYFEGIADGSSGDADGMMRTFSELAGAGLDETVVFAYMEFSSQDHRDTVTAAVRNDSEYQEQFQGEMPFNPERMATGRFSSIVNFEA